MLLFQLTKPLRRKKREKTKQKYTSLIYWREGSFGHSETAPSVRWETDRLGFGEHENKDQPLENDQVNLVRKFQTQSDSKNSAPEVFNATRGLRREIICRNQLLKNIKRG